MPDMTLSDATFITDLLREYWTGTPTEKTDEDLRMLITSSKFHMETVIRYGVSYGIPRLGKLVMEFAQDERVCALFNTYVTWHGSMFAKFLRDVTTKPTISHLTATVAPCCSLHNPYSPGRECITILEKVSPITLTIEVPMIPSAFGGELIKNLERMSKTVSALQELRMLYIRLAGYDVSDLEYFKKHFSPPDSLDEIKIINEKVSCDPEITQLIQAWPIWGDSTSYEVGYAEVYGYRTWTYVIRRLPTLFELMDATTKKDI